MQSVPRLLCNLRWLAVICQSLTIGIAAGPLGVALHTTPLWIGVAVLAIFNVHATWQARRGDETPAGVSFTHLLVDIAVLAWLVAWSGGIENPFSSLFLLPIVLAVFALPRRWLWLSANDFDQSNLAVEVGVLRSKAWGRPM